MRKSFFTLAVILILASCGKSTYRNPYAEEMQWWSEARYGMFIHWGISSLEGFEISWPRNDFGPARYDSLAYRFNPYLFDADKWIETAENAGMKYVVLTAKHHDGFCLWGSETTDHDIMNTPYGKDVCAQLADAAHRHGMRLGWYFTAQEWYDPDCSSPEGNDRFVAKMKTQLRELLTNYGTIDLLWFDFDGYPCPADPQEIFDYVRELAPGIVINNRLYPIIGEESHAYVGSCGMYATPEQFVGGYGVVPWETCSTSSTSRQWSIRYNDPPRPAEDLIWETVGAAGGNGNMLMNVGPDSLGVIPAEYAARLAEVGDWIKDHDGILYGTTCGPWKPCSKYVSTSSGRIAYLLLKEGGDITLPFSDEIMIESACADGVPVEFSTDGSTISFTLPSELVGKPDVAIRLVLGKEPGKGFTPLSPAGTSGSLAYDKPATASSSLSDIYMHCPASAFDDNWQTFWRPGRNCSIEDNDLYGTDVHCSSEKIAEHFHNDATLEVDLQECRTVTCFRIIPEDPGTGSFSLQCRKGGKWQEVACTEGIEEEWRGEITKTRARRWRLVIKDANSGSWGFGIREFRLFGPSEQEGPEVRFNADGKLKIAQFTDTHLCWTDRGEYDKTYKQLCSILDAEKPDVVIFTGDVVAGEGGADDAMEKFFNAIDERGIPFVSLYGNHDRERDLSEWELAEAVTRHRMSLNTMENGYLDDIALPVKSADGSKVAAVLYCIDSNDYTQVPEYYDYAWISHSQIGWYESRSKAFAEANGRLPVPSYAFFHIPLLEFSTAYSKARVCGERKEDECPGELNSGLFSAFVENQDVHGVFCGHDHDNDYIAEEGGIALVYGRYSGDNTVYNNLEHGVRIIELTEGDFGFRTWVRERSLSVADDITYEVPVDFTLHKAVQAEGKVHGVLRTRYDGIKALADMESEGVKGESKIVACPRIWGNLGTPDYGYTFEGYLYVPQTALWNLLLQADNEAVITIDDFQFGDQPGRFGWGRSRAYLEKGYHHVKVALKCYSNNCYVKMMWYPQGEDRYHEIRPEYWYVR